METPTRMDDNNSDGLPDEDTDGMQMVIGRRNKRNAPDSSPDGLQAQTAIPKKLRNERTEIIKKTLYIKGVKENIGQAAKKQPVLYKKGLTEAFGELESIKLTGESIRVTCKTEMQKTNGSKVTSLLNKDVVVSEPFSMNHEFRPQQDTQRLTANLQVRGIIFGVPVDITDDELKSEIAAQWVKRLVKRAEGNNIATETVIFGVDSETLPKYVYIGCISKRVKEYIPAPLRCFKCQGYGHRSTQCYSQDKCPRCAQNHRFENCTATTERKCPNCNGNHSAGFRECPKHKEVQNTLRVAVEGKMSYAEATKQLVKSNQNHEISQLNVIQEELNVNDSAAMLPSTRHSHPQPPQVNFQRSQMRYSGSKRVTTSETQTDEIATEINKSTTSSLTTTDSIIKQSDMAKLSRYLIDMLKSLNVKDQTIAEIIKTAHVITGIEIRARKMST